MTPNHHSASPTPVDLLILRFLIYELAGFQREVRMRRLSPQEAQTESDSVRHKLFG